MKKTFKILFIITLILLMAATLCSCGVKKLNGWYNSEKVSIELYDGEKLSIEFYGNVIHIGKFIYDPYYDVYRWQPHKGTYKIIEDVTNPGALFIKITFPHQKPLVYTFEETETGIIINGDAFELVEQYPKDYWFKRWLCDIGLIESAK